MKETASSVAAPAPNQSAGSLRKRDWRTTFSALSNRHYRILWMSMFASFSAMQMQQVARGWLTAELTGNKALALGLVGLAMGLPQLVFALFGGAFADRFEKRRIMIAAQITMGLLALFNALLLQFHVIQVWHLIVLGLIQGSVFAFNMPARQAMIAEFLSGEELMNGIALNNAAMTSTAIIAPSVAGVLIAVPFVGLTGVYYLIAALYLVVIFSMFQLPAAPPRPGRIRQSMVKEIAAGIAYTRSNPLLLTFLALSLLSTALAMPYQTLLPIFARKVFVVGSGGLGLMSTSVGVGALAGSFFVAAMTAHPNKTRIQWIAGVGLGAFLAVFAAAPSFPIALLGLAFMGFCNTTFNAINGTLLMTNTAPEYYGRVMSLSMMTFSAMPIAALPMAAMADATGAPITLAVAGVALGVIILCVGLMNSRYRQLDTRPQALVPPLPEGGNRPSLAPAKSSRRKG